MKTLPFERLTWKSDLHLHRTGFSYKVSTAAWYGEHFVQSFTKILQLMQEIWSEHEKLKDRQTLNITFALWSWIVTFTFIRQGSVMRNIWHKFNKNSSIRYGDTEKSQKINRQRWTDTQIDRQYHMTFLKSRI